MISLEFCRLFIFIIVLHLVSVIRCPVEIVNLIRGFQFFLWIHFLVTDSVVDFLILDFIETLLTLTDLVLLDFVRLMHLLYCSKLLSGVAHRVLGLLLLLSSNSSPLLVVISLNPLKFQLKLHDFLVSQANFLLHISDLTSYHQFSTLCSNTRPGNGRLERNSCIWIVSLLEDLAPKIMLFHLEVVDLLDESNVFFQNPLVLF